MRKRYTQSELDEMYQLKRQGATYEEIARMFNRTTKAIGLKFSQMGWTNGQDGDDDSDSAGIATVDAPTAPTAKAKKPSLDDFQPRDIIKYLYNLGYRIENNKLVYVHRQVINLKTILED